MTGVKSRNSAAEGPRPQGKPTQSASAQQAVPDAGHSEKSQKKRARRRRRGKAGRGKGVQPAEQNQVLHKVKPSYSHGKAAQASVPPAPPVRPSAPSRPPHGGSGHHAPDWNRSDLYAALDLGTNNCRLLIATPTRAGQFRVVDAFSRIVRLGEGLGATGRLGDNAMDRAVEALKLCHGKLQNRSIRKARLIATEACRSAENGVAFLERVKAEAGLDLEIVDRQTEARLAVSGCGTLVDRGTDAVVLFDIGGGSSEIALIDVTRRHSPRLAEHIVAWTSLPVGVVSLAERFGGRDVTAEKFAAMVDHVSGLLESFGDRGKLGQMVRSPRFHLLGTSGTVTTLAGIHLGLERYDRRRIDGIWMKDEDVTQMTGKLLSWSFEERVANACIGADRADLVLAGCAILDAIRKVWPSQKLRVADRGLREGILTELMSRDGVWRNRRFRNGGARH
ncbi:MAG: Ppx/GppA family phosphatase [Phyllobacterium sp.]